MELYFWTFVVTVLIFGMGGGVSIYEGVQRLMNVSEIQEAKWSYAVLAFSAVFEGVTIRVAMREFRQLEKQGGFWRSLRATKDLTVVTVLLENAAALVGLAIAFLGIFLGNLLHMPCLDGVASILVGLTLAAVAVVLAIETKGLMIGEGATKEILQRIRQIAEREAGVVRAGAPLTMYFGPQSVLLALDVEFDKRLSAAEVTSVVDSLERNIRSQYPKIQRIFIEAESLSSKAREGA
jgi:divalent metal cation (Fe/Co/Zn/Cd) transporter